MGKTTLYHPVSLHVIRGAALYCGWSFGKIKQQESDERLCTATYTAEIASMPGKLATEGTLLRIHHDLQECFLDDIRIRWVHMTQAGKWTCKIDVDMLKGQPEIKSVPLPNPEPGLEPLRKESYRRGGGGGGGGPDLVSQLREIVARDNFVVLDTETTGLHRPCEIIDIAILDSQGVPLVNTLLSPKRVIDDFIVGLTGITNLMCFNAPSWTTVKLEVLEAIKGKDVLVYNAKFDRHMMHCTDEMFGLSATDYKEKSNWFCVMEAYAELHGEWDDYHGNFRWQKLTAAMQQQSLTVHDAHRAGADALMTFRLIQHLTR